MIGYCPRCQQPFSYNQLDEDYVHQCSNTSETLQNEDLTDYSKQSIPIANKLAGTRSGHEGAKSFDLNSRGNKEALVTTRAHNEFLTIKNGKVIGEGYDE